MLRVWQAAAMSSPSGPPPGAPGPAEERARTRRVALLVGSVIVVLTLLATIVPHLLRPPVPAGAGVPGGPSVEAVPLPEESFYPPEEYPELVLPPVPDGCPKPLVELGVHVQADWFPVVVANGQEYQMQETYRPLTLGPRWSRSGATSSTSAAAGRRWSRSPGPTAPRAGCRSTRW